MKAVIGCLFLIWFSMTLVVAQLRRAPNPPAPGFDIAGSDPRAVQIADGVMAAMGRVFRNGEELTNPDSVAKYVKQGKRNWLNDSYWLLMPFKLKDNGVTLKYLGDELTQAGKPADVLQLTFKNGPVASGSKYKVWVDKKSHLVSQWAQYPKLTDNDPLFTLPWDDYQTHGSILLSGERGDHDLTDIMVFTGLPGEVFSDFTRTDLSRYPQAK